MHRIYFANLILDPTTRKLSNSRGSDVPLRPLPYQVLNLLIEKQGVHVTREELFETCWDGSVVTDQALTNVISGLRKKLGQLDAKGVKIKTVSKIGYLLEIDDDAKPTKQKVQIPDLETLEPESAETVRTCVQRPTESRDKALNLAPMLSLLLVLALGSVLYFRPFAPHPDFLNNSEYDDFSVSETDFYFYDLKHDELNLSALATSLNEDSFPVCPAIVYLRVSESAYQEGAYILRAFAFAKNSNKNVNYINFSLEIESLKETILESMRRADAICK
ncbi:transcriptional regulator [Vibrio harveyi]|jgi:DNA-binding winged helix-turn-helix (wHTH) protein|uniref:winged helix-turn-helix domain-containing protein n=1 Tax=Vibrio harveyi TaxID=669 RepID=UPI000C7D8AEA|nr:winged helix-turn-helix domain-containing protein [Vibrio harveyi]AWB01816.1 transcriptional regulator [Vibrio harveyi]